MKSFYHAFRVVLINLLVLIVGLEIGLRIFPSAIPEGILKRFEAGLRANIAQRRSLPNVSDVNQLERDDGGPPLLVFKPDTVVQFVSRETGKRGSIHMDSRGFCNPPGTLEDGGSIDVVALGDSFTACMNEPPDSAAPESYVNWPFELGRISGLSVYNLSRGGDGPYEYVQLLKHRGLQFRPKIVVMQMYEGNDLRDSMRYHAYKIASPEDKANVPLRASWEPLNVSYDWLLTNPLASISYAYDFAVVGGAYVLSQVIDLVRSGTDSTNLIDFRFSLDYPPSPILMNPDNDQKDEVRTARSAKDGSMRFQEFDEALEQYASLAASNNFKAVLSYAPAAHVAYGKSVSFPAPELKEVMTWYSNEQRAYLAKKCAELGILFVDLTPALQSRIDELGGSKLLYNPSNIHFTILGHQVVAQEVQRALAEAGLFASN